MDAIGSSCLSLHTEDEKEKCRRYEKDAKEPELKGLVASSKSLSRYESQTLKSVLPQIVAALIAASFHVGNGISLAYSAVLIAQLNHTDSPIKSTTYQNSWIASVLIVVSPPASLICGLIMERLGRLNSIKIASIPGIIGWTVIALAGNVPVIIVGRVFSGISSAWGTSPGIVYVSEIANVRLRMSLMALATTYVAFGMVITYLGGWYLHWRTLAWIFNVVTIVPSVACLMLHESPSWLILKGKHEAAKKSLRWLHRYQPEPVDKVGTFADLQYQVLCAEQQKKKEEERQHSDRKGARYIVGELLKPTGYKPLIILTGLFFFQHFSGIYITMFYSITFIKAAKTTVNPYFASVTVGLARLVMSIVSIFILRTFKRRNLLFVSTTCMALCMFVAGLSTKLIEQGTANISWIPVAALLCYVIASTVGLLPIPNMLMAELFPLEIRSIGYSISYSLCCVLMFLALQEYYDMNHFFGGSAHLQWFFAIVCLGGAVYTYIFVPETFKMKLTEITEYFKVRFIYICHREGAKVAKNGKNDVV